MSDPHFRRRGDVKPPSPLLVESSTSLFIVQLWCTSELGGQDEDEWCTDICFIEGKTTDEAMTNGLKNLPSADDFAKDAPDVNYIPGECEYWYTVEEVDKEYLIQALIEHFELFVGGPTPTDLRTRFEAMFK